MLFRQLFDRTTCTYTYLLACSHTREAVVVDPVRELFDRDRSLVRELDLELVAVLETHVHADHVTSAALWRGALGAKTVVSVDAGVLRPDREVRDGDVVRFGEEELTVRSTPGHTAGCVTYVSQAGRFALTGDALFVRGCGRTDFQGGDARTLYRSVHDKILSLDDDFLLYPGHDYQGRTVTTVGEELRHNPRLGAGRTEDEFVVVMAALDLGLPAQIAVAVPANLRSGETPDDAGP